MIFGFCVFFCIYEVEKMCFLEKMSQKSEQFSYEVFWGIFGGIVGPKWSPYVAEASLGRVSNNQPQHARRAGAALGVKTNPRRLRLNPRIQQ